MQEFPDANLVKIIHKNVNFERYHYCFFDQIEIELNQISLNKADSDTRLYYINNIISHMCIYQN